MRIKDFIIALPLNLFFATGMLYLRDIKGAFLLFGLGVLFNLVLWPVYFLVEFESRTANICALLILGFIGVFGVALLILITWASAKNRTLRTKLGFKKFFLAFVALVAGSWALSNVSPRYAPTFSGHPGWLEPFNVPAGSMVPTLLVGDYFFATKISSSQPLKRGDIAVFYLPTNTSVSFVKRIVGLPGDRIQVKDGVLHINNISVERAYLGQATATNGVMTINFKVYEETLPNGSKHLIQERSDNDAFDNTAEYQVPEGYYFMMGDNRDNSRDSRTSFVGMVPAANIYRKAKTIFFSHNGHARIWEFWKWPFAIRYGRIGDGII